MNEEQIVLIEIPAGSTVKYELNEKTGQMMVDRLMPTAMGYPVNYGLIEETLGEDGDALDTLVFISAPVISGVRIKCRIIGLLEMEDEEGVDWKIVCVPATTKIDPICGAWQSMADVPAAEKNRIRHFFEHYKDLETGKWVKLKEWRDAQAAFEVLAQGKARLAAEHTNQ